MTVKSGILIVVGVVVFFAVALTTPNPALAQPNAGRDRWEHLALTVDAATSPGGAEESRRIVQLGADGWELVDVETLVKEGTSTKLIYFFKRPN